MEAKVCVNARVQTGYVAIQLLRLTKPKDSSNIRFQIFVLTSCEIVKIVVSFDWTCN